MAENKGFMLPKMNIGAASSNKTIVVRNVEPKEESNEIKKTSINLPIDVYRDLRKLAAMEDRRLGDIVEEAILDVLRKHGL